MISKLTDRAVIAVSGPDAREFLQNLITNDVEKLTPGGAIYAALLTPQGKILFDFLIAQSGGALLIDCPRAAREGLVRRLSMYKLRAKVQIAPRDDLGVFASPGPLPGGFADPRLEALGYRAIVQAMPVDNGPEGYHALRLGLGVPEGADFGSDRMFALDGGLNELHAIAFNKGCYVGQEVTARMKHRGKDAKRLLPVTAADGTRSFALIRLIEAPESEKPLWLFS